MASHMAGGGVPWPRQQVGIGVRAMSGQAAALWAAPASLTRYWIPTYPVPATCFRCGASLSACANASLPLPLYLPPSNWTATQQPPSVASAAPPLVLVRPVKCVAQSDAAFWLAPVPVGCAIRVWSFFPSLLVSQSSPKSQSQFSGQPASQPARQSADWTHRDSQTSQTRITVHSKPQTLATALCFLSPIELQRQDEVRIRPVNVASDSCSLLWYLSTPRRTLI